MEIQNCGIEQYRFKKLHCGSIFSSSQVSEFYCIGSHERSAVCDGSSPSCQRNSHQYIFVLECNGSSHPQATASNPTEVGYLPWDFYLQFIMMGRLYLEVHMGIYNT